jgi:hypothetical protein
LNRVNESLAVGENTWILSRGGRKPRITYGTDKAAYVTRTPLYV